MASVNKVIIIGNLGRNPELRYSPDGTAMCSLSIATTFGWRDRASGERREETEWHRVTLFGRLAEVAGEYLRKGSPIYIEGRLRTRKWQDKTTGQDRYTTEIVGEQMQMLGSRSDNDNRQPQAQQTPASTKNSYADAKSGTGSFDDDIPFAPKHGRRAYHF